MSESEWKQHKFVQTLWFQPYGWMKWLPFRLFIKPREVEVTISFWTTGQGTVKCWGTQLEIKNPK